MKLWTERERRHAMHVHSDIHPVHCLNRKISVIMTDTSDNRFQISNLRMCKTLRYQELS